MEIFGVRILGLNEAGLRKLALTVAVLVIAFGARWVFRVVAAVGFETLSRRTLWARKTIRLLLGLVTTLLVLSIWFDDPGRLASFMGLIAAGLAFAAQNLVLSMAGYCRRHRAPRLVMRARERCWNPRYGSRSTPGSGIPWPDT